MGLGIAVVAIVLAGGLGLVEISLDVTVAMLAFALFWGVAMDVVSCARGE